jgi:transketolase N-terminal domain/subunit
MIKQDEFLTNLKDVIIQATSSNTWLLITNKSDVVSKESLAEQFEANGYLVNEGSGSSFFVAKVGA